MHKYFRTSSLLGCNIKNAFDAAIEAVIAKRKGLKVNEITDDENNLKSDNETDKDQGAKKCIVF